MTEPAGLRERKKLRQRRDLADAATQLFAERGYDDVAVRDVAHAAGVSEQTVYNYFPAKHDLVLDRADAILAQYESAVRDRPADVSPAAALRPLVHADVDRLPRFDPVTARGSFAALCLQSEHLRRFALAFRERQTEAVARAILSSRPTVNPLIAHAHAAALIAVSQAVTDRIGHCILTGHATTREARRLSRDAGLALDDLDRHWTTTTRA